MIRRKHIKAYSITMRADKILYYYLTITLLDLRNKRSKTLTTGFSRYFRLKFWQGSGSPYRGLVNI